MICWAPNGDRSAPSRGPAGQKYEGTIRRLPLGPAKNPEFTLYVDVDDRADLNQVAAAFGVTAHGVFGLGENDNWVKSCCILKNLLKFHDVIYGRRVESVNHPDFCVSIPSYSGFFDVFPFSALNCDEDVCEEIVKECRKNIFRDFLSDEEFFKMYPETGCPYTHLYNDEISDEESTCTLCEGMDFSKRETPKRSRSMSRSRPTRRGGNNRSRSRSRSNALSGSEIMRKRIHELQNQLIDWERWQQEMCVCGIHLDYPTPTGPNSGCKTFQPSCLECGDFLGQDNPRQLCGKTHCINC